MRENLTSKKPKLNQIIRIKLILIGLLLAYSLYQVLNWNLFPWFNFVVIFGSSFLSLIFALVVKIQSRIIKILILTIASIQLFISAIFHTFHELLRVNWQWLFFPITIVFCLVFWDLLLRRTSKIKFFGRIICSMLLICTFYKFLVRTEWNDFLLIGFVSVIIILLIFSNNKTSEKD